MEIIIKSPEDTAQSNLGDYEDARRNFCWDDARALLDGLPYGALNIAHEAVDRHASGGLADKVAIRWIAKDNARQDFTYADLKAQTGRFANALRGLGINRGDRVYTLLGRVPELYIAALGTWKAGAVFCPMFSAFGPLNIKGAQIYGRRIR
jgi:acetyl-CoA synthetase